MQQRDERSENLGLGAWAIGSFLVPGFWLLLAHGKSIQRSTKIPIGSNLARH